MTVDRAHNHASHAGQSHAQWLRYSNQGATRNKPLAPSLVNAMSFLGDMGITASVVSGGQDGRGEGDRRTGSTRHDHGNAADVDFFLPDGTQLRSSNPAHVPILTEIVQRARANGLTGFGEGADYMGDGRMHIGFGNPGVWGAGGRGANAPAWLTAAFNSAPAGSTPALSPQGGRAIPVATTPTQGQPRGGFTQEQIAVAMEQAKQPQQAMQAPEAPQMQVAPRQPQEGYRSNTDALANAMRAMQALQQRRKGLLG